MANPPFNLKEWRRQQRADQRPALRPAYGEVPAHRKRQLRLDTATLVAKLSRKTGVAVFVLGQRPP